MRKSLWLVRHAYFQPLPSQSTILVHPHLIISAYKGSLSMIQIHHSWVSETTQHNSANGNKNYPPYRTRHGKRSSEES